MAWKHDPNFDPRHDDPGFPAEERFDVWWFDPDGWHERIGSDLDANDAVALAKEWTLRPAALIGIVARIIITDSGDSTVFEWRHGEGVVFPPPDKIEVHL